jgi:energy-coupling factor transporter ATP-binding protein EcfA2
MFLHSISLRNVRSIESLNLQFGGGADKNRKWTVLLGENGCGKSSVLRAIALVLAGSEALPELLGEPDAWIRNGARSCCIEAVLQTAEGKPREIALNLKRGDGLIDVFIRNAESLAALDAAIAHAQRNYFVLGYGVSRRPAANTQQAIIGEDRSRSPRARGLATMFSGESAMVSLEQWAMDLEYRRGAGALQSVRKALEILLPDLRFKGINREQRSLVFRTKDGDVPLAQLSDGYQNMAAWCGDLLFRITETFPDRKNPLDTRGVLLIDELDLHLHPIWRRQLVEFLSRTLPNFQIIATTHSALTAQQCGEGELYVIRREGDKQRPALVPFVGDPRKMLLHQLLMSPMFELPSMDSVEVEAARSEMRALSEAPAAARSGAARSRMRNLRTQLAAAPEWDAVAPFAREQAALIQDLHRALVTRSGRPPRLSTAKLRAKVKAVGNRP